MHELQNLIKNSTQLNSILDQNSIIIIYETTHRISNSFIKFTAFTALLHNQADDRQFIGEISSNYKFTTLQA